MAHHAYLNGKINSVEATNIHFTDLGLLRGYALFDYFVSYNGRPFMWDWYWERFSRSAQLMGLPNPISKEDAYQVVLKLIKKSGLAKCGIRFLLTGGYSENSIKMNRPNLLIISEDIHAVKQTDYETGIKIITHNYVRDYPEIKSTDYKHLMMLQLAISQAQASDVLFHHQNYISELSRSNIFMFKDDVLVTPKDKILKGITRRVVLDLAKGNFKVEERNIKLSELMEADEIFTTSSTKKILPITTIDNHYFSERKIGDRTKQLLELINKRTNDW